MSNTWLETILTVAAAVGIGTIISSLTTIFYERRKFIFETKMIKYSNLIQAYQDNAATSNEVNKQNYVSHQKQVELHRHRGNYHFKPRIL